MLEMESRGWGAVSTSIFDPINGVVEVDIADNPFFDFCDDSASLPQCFFYRGTVVGVFNAILGQDFKIEKHECALKDNKQFCRISLRRL